ncbi:MAG: hypothetical protein AAB541_00350 [Patescibacteria group bacterium]
MEEEQKEEKPQVPSAAGSESGGKLPVDKKTTYSILAAVVVLIVLGSLFFVGKNSFFKKAESSPTPSPSASPSASPSPSPSTSPKASPKVSPTPTPTPTPSPTPSPSPTFSVTGVTAAVSPTSYSGACPKEFVFSANITANGAGTVTYKWTRSDGASGQTKSLVFSGAGTQAAEGSTWTLGGSGNTYNNWEKVQILTPNTTESNQANFSLNCS